MYPEFPLRSSKRMTMEAHLAGVVLRAEAEYEAATQSFELATRRLDDLGWECPDGRAALYQAVVDHNRAFRKYKRILVDFQRFILDGTAPDELEDST
jgi:hypothetical protein